MAYLNKAMFIGRVIDDPEPVKTLGNGNKVTKIRLAVSRNKKNHQTGQWENDPNPLYLDCEAFSYNDNARLVDLIANYVRKGASIYIEGRLQLDTWEDKSTGQKRSKHKLIVTEIQMLDGKKAPTSDEKPPERSPFAMPNSDSDDIPF